MKFEHTILYARKKVVHELHDMLAVWREHFANLCTPKTDASFDDEHFAKVNEMVINLDNDADIDRFTASPVTTDEVRKAIMTLHEKKACGIDNISTEHILLTLYISFP